MSPLRRIEDGLRGRPGVEYRVEDGLLTVRPPSPTNYSATFAERGGAYDVALDGWHEHFGSEDEAVACFGFALGGECRLKVYRRGGMEYRWALEVPSADGWREESATGLLFFPFWRRREVIYRTSPARGVTVGPDGDTSCT